MTKKEQAAFNAMAKAVFKHGRLVQNDKLPKDIRLGKVTDGSTVVIPTFKIIKELKKFVKKVEKREKA